MVFGVLKRIFFYFHNTALKTQKMKCEKMFGKTVTFATHSFLTKLIFGYFTVIQKIIIIHGAFVSSIELYEFVAFLFYNFCNLHFDDDTHTEYSFITAVEF